MAQKRKRVVLPIEEKQKIIAIKEDHPEMTYTEIVSEYYNLSKKVISESTVQKIWANKESILLGVDGKSAQQNNHISISTATIQRVEEARKAEKDISESFVITQAQKVVQQYKLNPSDYYFSANWARDIMKGKVDDTIILRTKSAVKKENTKTNQDHAVGINRLVGLSEGEKKSILENSTPQITVKKETESVSTPKKSVKRRQSTPTPKMTAPKYIDLFQSFLKSHGVDRDYKSVLYEILEESYKNSPYYVAIMQTELESVKRTLQFMVDKENHKW